jgi:hypothetical protein
VVRGIPRVSVATSVFKIKAMLSVEKWMELESIVLSEVSQAQKDKHHMVLLICRIKT